MWCICSSKYMWTFVTDHEIGLQYTDFDHFLNHWSLIIYVFQKLLLLQLTIWNQLHVAELIHTVHTSYNLNMTCVHMQRPHKIHMHDFVIYMQLYVLWITFVYRPTPVSTNYLHEKFNFTHKRVSWMWQV